MTVYFAVRPNNKTFSTRCTRALASRMGGTIIQRSDTCPADASLLVHWGFKRSQSLKTAIESRIPFVILDRGYFDPDRVDRVSISFNGHHGLSMETRPLAMRRTPIMMPWRESDFKGEYCLIIGQLPNDASLRGNCIDAWMGRTAQWAVDHYKLPAIKRPHPKSLERWEPAPEPLDKAFEKAHVVCTFSSTTAVQSIIAGIPTLVDHPASPAFGVTEGSNRDKWIQHLAQREYDLLDETDADACVAYIRHNLDEATELAADGLYDTGGLR